MNTVLYDFGDILVRFLGFQPVYQVIAAAALILLVYITAVQRSVFMFFAYAFLISPVFVPFLTTLSGFHFFTGLNPGLQMDRGLVVAACLLLSLMLCSTILGYYLAVPGRAARMPRFPTLPRPLVQAICAAGLVMIFFFLESTTIIYASYAELNANKLSSSSAVQQIFNLIVVIAVVGAFGSGSDRTLKIFLLVALVITLLLSRRTLATSIIILYFYMFSQGGFSVRQYIFIALGLALLLLIGEARKVGLVNFLSGAADPQLIAGYYAITYYNMPGGGSHVLMSALGVIHLINAGTLTFPETYPMLLWFSGMTESAIYESKGYQYGGGMPLAAVLYWNFGLLGVVMGGALLGMLLRFCRHELEAIGDGRRTLARAVAVMVVMVAPVLFWYSPVGFVNAMLAVLGLYIIATLMPQKRAAPTGA